MLAATNECTCDVNLIQHFKPKMFLNEFYLYKKLIVKSSIEYTKRNCTLTKNKAFY